MKFNICNAVLGACKVILQVQCLFGRIIILFLQCFLMYFFPLCQVTQLFFFLKLLKTFLAITPTLNTLFKLTPIKHRLLHTFSMFWLPVFMYYLTSFQNQILTKIKRKVQKCWRKFKSLTMREAVFQLLKYFKLFVTFPFGSGIAHEKDSQKPHWSCQVLYKCMNLKAIVILGIAWFLE